MAAKSSTTTTTAAALADAFAALSVEGQAVTVRALRERAKVSTDAASAWLRTNRPTRDIPPVPADALERVLLPLWSAAVAAARDEHAEADTAERAALIQAETDALTELAAATSRAEDAEDEVAQLRREVANLTARLDAAEAAREQQAGLAAAATREAIEAREAAHKAELAAAEAQATARTLREILDTVTAKGTGSLTPE
ncbi:MAG: hypothetical protein QG671_1018 [Actinomycetota bacterium]|jgi:hypothetical protein|nr:hypothetical protein [Actinomycetota bacterium]